MEAYFSRLNIFIIPPLISLLFGITLAFLSIYRGKLKYENILFSIVCIQMVLLAPAFISHQLFKGNEELILKIERTIHFFYVYVSPVNLLYFFHVTNTHDRKSKILIGIAFVISFVLSLLTQTDYYFYGLYSYSWGYIAKGGIAFQVFGAYGTAVIIYLAFFIIKKMRMEHNSLLRLKYKYLLLSFVAAFLLTLSNIPAINGIDIYPMGNMIFIPLAFLGYGILSYRLMDVRSVLHITFIWAITSSLIIIPNAVLFYFLYSYVIKTSPAVMFFIIFLWFMINFIYIRVVQPYINQVFNRRKYNLRQIESDFIEIISSLKTIQDLMSQTLAIIKRSLSLGSAEFLVKDAERGIFTDRADTAIEISKALSEWMAMEERLLDSNIVQSSDDFAPVRGELTALFTACDADYIAPLVNNGELVGLIAMPEKPDLRPLTDDEVQFINNIRSAASISLANSIMYSDLSDLNESLEKKVAERTEKLTEALDSLWGEMELAKKIQTVMLPRRPSIPGYEISAFMDPADEVGGDYYDVISASGIDWVVIGDVSGHGVPAGLIMMMVQTSIHTALATEPDLKPNALLSLVNRVITENIKKLNEDKYMTITVLACAPGGTFHYSGLHQDIMMYRALSQAVEIVETNGMWLGMDIEPWSAATTETLGMGAGDVMLLYTDGITEAFRKDKTGDDSAITREMFGSDRLMVLLEQNGQEPPDVIKTRILHALKDYHHKDDITMLILKRN